MNASVVIITKGDRPEWLGECLVSLKKQTAENFEVVVVGSAEHPEIEFLCEKFNSLVRYILQSGHGIPNARNTGLKVSKGEVVAFIDDDSVAHPDWLQNLLNSYNEKIDAVCGRILPYSTRTIAERSEANYRDLGSKQLYVSWGDTTNMSIRRKAIERLGGFNENLMIGEDVEFGYKISLSGLTIMYEPKAIVRHRNQTSFRKYIEETYERGFHYAKLMIDNTLELFAITELFVILMFFIGLEIVFTYTLYGIMSLFACISFILLFLVTIRLAYEVNPDKSYMNIPMTIVTNLLSYIVFTLGKLGYIASNPDKSKRVFLKLL